MLGAREVFEPVDALCADAAAATRLAQVLARQGRPLTLDRVPANSTLLKPLQAACKGKAWVTVKPAIACPTIALDERWREPEACFNSGRRSDFRRAARRAAEFGPVTFEILSPAPEQFDALFDEAVAVEQSSWKKEAGTAMAMDRAKESFFRAYFRACCENGQFRVAFMRIDGKAVAMQLAVESCERFWLFKIGFDEAYAKCSPGTLLMLHTLRHAACNDLRAYELLGNIEPWIAEFWTREQHACVRLRTYPFNFRGAVAFVADAANWLRSWVTRSGR
jgi:CelD/BcsL family acetyltransferase involved in cellulose biosynthesis